MQTPCTFRAAPSAYALLCGLCSIPALLWIVYFIRTGRFEIDFFLAVLALPLAWAIWLAAFRLRIDTSGIAYRCLFKGERRLEYSRIEAVREGLRAPVTRTALGISLRLTDGNTVLINLKPFPRAAIDAVCSIPCLGRSDLNR